MRWGTSLFDSVTCHESPPSALSMLVLTRFEHVCLCVSVFCPLMDWRSFAFSVYPGHQRPAATSSTFPSTTTCEYITIVLLQCQNISVDANESFKMCVPSRNPERNKLSSSCCKKLRWFVVVFYNYLLLDKPFLENDIISSSKFDSFSVTKICRKTGFGLQQSLDLRVFTARLD